MTTTLNALAIRDRLGRHHYGVPEQFGPDGWQYVCGCALGHSVIVTVADWPAYGEFVHASIAGKISMPTYRDLVDLHRAVFDRGFAYQQFVPPQFHVNIHPNALHLYGRLDGKPLMPHGADGSI